MFHELFEKHGFPIERCLWVNEAAHYGGDENNKRRALIIVVKHPSLVGQIYFFFESYRQAIWAITHGRMFDFQRDM